MTSPIYSCQNCGAQYPKWQGRCNECGRWGSLSVDEDVTASCSSGKNLAKNIGKVKTVSINDLPSEPPNRLQTDFRQLDKLLAGGLVPGSLTLLAGEPGIGKSTLVLQWAAAFKNTPQTLYLAGEESPEQIKNRLDRLALKPNLQFLSQPTIEKCLAVIQQLKPLITIVDSIQTVASEQIPSPPGSLSQVRFSTGHLLEVCKKLGVCCLIIGQVTKDGLIAGPKSLEHLVDTVLYLEGDLLQNFRILRVTKNRFGPTDDVIVMKMTARGMEVIDNPSAIFLEGAERQAKEGAIITPVLDGSKIFLIEIQALVTPSSFGYPQRRSSGFDNNRLQLLLAVLTKRAGLADLLKNDVHINVAGGYKINEPAADLAVCLAISSSLLNKKIAQEALAFGEVGLGGEIRPVKRTEIRIKEAEKLGFNKIICPPTIKSLEEALKILE